MHLHDWGFDARIASFLAEGEIPGRAIAVSSNLCRAVFEDEERLLFCDPAARPATGDWIVAENGRVHRILPRRTVLSRCQPGRAVREQVLAANVDLLLIVSGLDHDLNLRRLERYLAMALSGATEPVIVLNKSDVCPRLDAAIGAVRSVAAGHPVLVCSALDKTGVEALRMLIAPGRTAAMVGSSGAGKSTLLNALLGSSVAATRAVREHDSRGRHTTTHREMFRLPGAVILLDQPGLREIKLWPAGGGVCQAFPDVAEAALACRFRDCSHSGEPGCAVTAAVGQERLESYRKLATQTGAIARKRQDRERSRALRKFLRTHDKRG